MKRISILAIALAVFLTPCLALSQMNVAPPVALQPGPGAPMGPPPAMVGGQPGMPLWNYIPGARPTRRPVYSDERWQLALSVAPGHQWINWTFDFPYSGSNYFNFEATNLKLNSEPFWMGFVGAELQPLQNWILYGTMGGNIPRNAEMVMNGTGRIFMPANPADPATDAPPNLTPPWIWTAKNFQWWMIEGGVLHAVTSMISLEIGFRVEHFDFQLVHPHNYTTPIPGALSGNRPIYRAITCPRVCPLGSGRLWGDPLAKNYIPYVGFRVTGRECMGKDCKGCPITRVTYKWRVIGSIFAWNDLSDPMNLNCHGPNVETNRALYTMNGDNGLFLETEGQLYYPLFTSLDLYGWGTASWLDISGKGRLVATIHPGNTSPANDPYTDIFGGRPGSASVDDASFYRSYYALGLGLRLTL